MTELHERHRVASELDFSIVGIIRFSCGYVEYVHCGLNYESLPVVHAFVPIGSQAAAGLLPTARPIHLFFQLKDFESSDETEL